MDAFRAVAARHPRLADFEPHWEELLPELRRIEASRKRWRWIGIAVIAFGWIVAVAILALVEINDETPIILAGFSTSSPAW